MALTKVGKEGITGISNSSDATAITILSDENIGIGTTSINSGTLGTSNKFLEVSAGTASGSGTLVLSRDTSSNGVEIGAVRFVNANNATDGSNDNSGKLVGVVGCRTVTTDTNAGDDSGGDLVFSTKPETGTLAEGMRINSNGRVDMGTGSYSNGAKLTLSFTSTTEGGLRFADTATSGTHTQVQFLRGGTQCGKIECANQASTAYVTSSDYRMKDNVNYSWDATTKLKQLKPAEFTWKEEFDTDKTQVQGFLAHEVSSIVPEAISGEKDAVDDDGNAVYQGIDQSKLVPLLVKTIQELEARITALENG